MQLKHIFPLCLLTLATTALLLAACSQGESLGKWEEDTLCTPEPFEFTEEELSWPEPTGLEYRSEESRKNWRKWKAVGERAEAIRAKYEGMFWRQPNVWSVWTGFGEDEHGEIVYEVGFIIRVTELVPQESLPEEDRLPECLEGIPVHIFVQPRVYIIR